MLRRFSAVIAVLAVLIVMAAVPVRADDPKMKVTLLGTAGPEYFPDRLGISTLVEANGELLLFDVGRGTNQRLYQSRVNPKDIAKIFLTHLHSDHIEGLPDLWMTAWFLLGRDHGFELWGPEGTEEMAQGMRKMFGHDLKARVNQFNPIETLAIRTHIISDGVVYEKNGVRVTAFPVEHADGNPAFGYSVDWNGHRVVLSGDTTLHENVITHGTGADLIVHNVIAFSDQLSQLPEMKGVLAKLTTPEQAAEVFKRAKPKLAVLQRVCDCTDAAGNKAGQGTRPKQIRWRRISDRPSDNGEGHDSHDGNGEQALEQALAHHKMAPLGSGHQNQVNSGKGHQADLESGFGAQRK